MLITLSSAADSFHSSTLNTGRDLRIEISSLPARCALQRRDDRVDELRGLLGGVALDHLRLEITLLLVDGIAHESC